MNLSRSAITYPEMSASGWYIDRLTAEMKARS
ncbi:hypothetical protein SY94_5477 (plasmid) [Agrobacterium tumefaciens]|nr:hypothetical protein SY94_5477 [Agrobacterium tumefaciens]